MYISPLLGSVSHYIVYYVLQKELFGLCASVPPPCLREERAGLVGKAAVSSLSHTNFLTPFFASDFTVQKIFFY